MLLPILDTLPTLTYNKPMHTTINPPRLSPLLTASEVAERYQVARSTIVRWTREGRLPVVQIGRVQRYRLTDLEALDAQRAAHSQKQPG